MKHDDDAHGARSDGHSHGPSTVLVVGDGAAAAGLDTLLAGRPSYSVHHAVSFAAAMEIYTTVRVHLVVLAISDRDQGLEHLRALLGSDRQRRVPIVVVVRGPRGGDHLEFLRAGAHDAVSVLDSDAELLARVDRRLTQEGERATQAMARRYSLAGDLTGLGLTDIITVLEQSALTGSLDLMTRRGAAQLLFRDGQIRYASYGNTRGRVAFFELLREREGQFEFAPGEWSAPDEKGALEGPNTTLLLEGSQMIDEGPDEGLAVVARPSAQDPRRVVPALRPDPDQVGEWLRNLGQAPARGEIRLLARDQVRDWTSIHPGGTRLRLALLTDVACGVQVVSQLATPLGLEDIADSLRRPPVALGLTWKIAPGQSVEILLLDQERLRMIADFVRASPAVLILAPSYGDFLTFNMSLRATLQRLLRDAPPLGILGVGNPALEGQVGHFLKLAKLSFPTRFLRGSLWKLELTPRALVEEAIRQWAELPDAPRSRAA